MENRYQVEWYKPDNVIPARISTDEQLNYDYGVIHACSKKIYEVVCQRMYEIYGKDYKYVYADLGRLSCRTSIEIYNHEDKRLIVALYFMGDGYACIIVPNEVYMHEVRDNDHPYIKFTYGDKDAPLFSSYCIAHEEIKNR